MLFAQSSHPFFLQIQPMNCIVAFSNNVYAEDISQILNLQPPGTFAHSAWIIALLTALILKLDRKTKILVSTGLGLNLSKIEKQHTSGVIIRKSDVSWISILASDCVMREPSWAVKKLD